MRSIRNAALAAALLCASFAAGAQQRQIEVGNYPTAGALTGSERMLSDQAGITVDILPTQIAQYLATSGAIFSMLPSPLVSGYVLGNNGTSLVWVPASSTGTVTSVGLSVPSWLAVSGSPVTTSGTLAVTGATGQPTYEVISTDASGAVALRVLPAAAVPPINLAGTGNGGVFGITPVANGGTGTTSPALVAGTNVTITGSWPNQTINAAGASFPSCTASQLYYAASSGTTASCLTLGTNLSISGGVLNATAGGGGVSSFSGDGTLLNNSSSVGAVTATLANTGIGYGVLGNTGATSGAPGYHALSSYPTAAFPTLNQNTSGTAAGLSATLVASSGGTGSGTAPSSGQIPVGNVGGTAYAPQSVSGDCTLASTGAITCTKTSGTAFSALATTAPGTGIATFLATPTATNLGAAVTGAGLVGGTNVTVTGTWPNQTISATAGGGGVSSFSGDGALLSNSGSTGGVTATLANTGLAYGIWGGVTGASGAPAYHSLSSYPLAAFPSGLAQLAAVQLWAAAQTFPSSDILIQGSSTGTTALASANAGATNYTATFPAATDTVVELAATQTLTNKSIAASEVNSGTLAAAQMPALTGDCTTSAGAVATNCTKTGGVAFGTFATANAATPPAIGGTTPAAGAFTTLSASSTVSGAGFSTYLASPPAIGGTAAAAGSFTTLSASGQITSTVTTGTAPLVVSSTTQVANLQAATAGALAATPTQCTGGQFSTGIAASGNANCGTPAGGGTVNAALQYSLPYYSAAGTANTLSGLNSPTANGYYALRYDVTASGAVAPTADQLGTAPRSVSGSTTTDTVLYSDVGGLVVHDKAATGTLVQTLPTPTSLGNTHFYYNYCNNSAQTDSITPTTYTIASNAGSAGASISIGSGVCVQVSLDPFNASQWDAWTYGASGGGSGTVTTTGSPAITYLAGFSGATSITGTANATLSAGALTLGVSGTAGSIALGNSTSGTVTIQPVTGALGSVTASLPANTGTIAELNFAQSWTAAQTYTNGIITNFNPGSTQSGIALKGAPFTGGTGTTTAPYFYLQQGATAPTTWSTTGTEIGINAPSGFTGNFEDDRINGGTSVFSVNYQGNVVENALTIAGITGSTQCLHVSTAGVVSGTGSDCGSGGSGTVTDGSGTTTANELLLSTTTAHTYSVGAVNSTALAVLQDTTAITVSGCTPSASSLAPTTGGTITQPATACTTATFTFAVTAPHGWHCSMGDITQTNAGTYIPPWVESSSTTTTCVVKIPAAAQVASDQLSLQSSWY